MWHWRNSPDWGTRLGREMIDRRRFIAAAAGSLGIVSIPGAGDTAAQDRNPEGRIAFIRDGDVWEWSSDTGTHRLIEDGQAMDPTWNPTGRLLMYARDGGSFSDLIVANPSTGNRNRLTDNESTAEVGSPEYVNGCSWAIDPFWSDAGFVCYVSDAESEFGEMRIWILDPDDGSTYLANMDGGDQGPVEHVSVGGAGVFCVYTVLSMGGPEGGTTYVSMRDLDTGTTYPLFEGERGAYDPAISPDADWIVGSVRDAAGMSDLWIFDRVSEELSQLTTGEQASNATWSPDGEWIAYLRRVDDRFEVWSLPINTRTGEPTGEARRLVEADGIDATSGLSWTRL